MNAKLAGAALIAAVTAIVSGNVEAAGPITPRPTTPSTRMGIVPMASSNQFPLRSNQYQLPQYKPSPVQVATQPKTQQPTPRPQQTVSLPQYKPFVPDPTLKLSAPTPVKATAPKVALSIQTTNSVDVPFVSVTKSCDVATNKCTKSVSVTVGGLTASAARNGDICFGTAQKGGVGVYGKASQTGCFNVKDGTIAGKVNASGGVGLGIDGLSVGSTIGGTVTVRTKPDKAILNSMTTGFPGLKR